LGLVLACDLVIASEDAVFALPEPKRGITAAVVTPLLAYRMGPGVSGYLLLSGRRISATDGLRWGLCHEIVTADELMNRRDELAKSVLTGSQSALAVTKANITEGAAAMLADWLDSGMTASARARENQDAREGLAAFLEKRDPRWLSDP
jgi:methylglutaconyl-CoA hydratase